MLLSKPCVSPLHLSTREFCVPLRDSKGRMSGLRLQNPAVKFLFFFTKSADTADTELDTGQQQREANYLCQIYRCRIYCTNTVDTQNRGSVKQTSLHRKYKAKCKLFRKPVQKKPAPASGDTCLGLLH